MVTDSIFTPWERFPDRYEDPYDKINNKYFAQILSDRAWNAHPAGWLNPVLDHAFHWRPPSISPDQGVPFLLDIGAALSNPKAKIAFLLEVIEGRAVRPEEFTLCASTTQANLIALLALRESGVSRIIIDCPAYYGTIEQALTLGFEVVLAPQTIGGALRGELAILDLPRATFQGAALWITQPHFAIGVNWDPTVLDKLLQRSAGVAAIVIDEAADQTLGPTAIREVIARVSRTTMLFRTKGLFKGIGLNGLRLSLVFHPKEFRSLVYSCLDTVGGSLDTCSLHSATEISERPSQFQTLLSCAVAQVQGRRKLAETAALGTPIMVSPLENAYIGTLFFPIVGVGNWPEKMEAFLGRCRDELMPVVISDSMYFMPGGDYGAIRINYFTDEANVIASVETLSRVI